MQIRHRQLLRLQLDVGAGPVHVQRLPDAGVVPVLRQLEVFPRDVERLLRSRHQRQVRDQLVIPLRDLRLDPEAGCGELLAGRFCPCIRGVDA